MEKRIMLKNRLKKLLSDEIESLKEAKESINITFEAVINISSLNKYNHWDEIYKDLSEKLKMLPKNTLTIYIIKSTLNYKKLSDERCKLIKDGYKVSKLNDKNCEQKKYIYVGQSKEVVKRLKQHLFYAPKGTYALRLNNLLKKESISIDIYGFDNKPKEVQVFEDLLWDWYKPLFGKRGPKG